MTERIFATGSVKERIEAELKAYRENHGQYIKEKHPQLSFVTLETLAHDQRYVALIAQPLLHYAFSLLARRLSVYEHCFPFDPARVWVGIQAQSGTEFFGGFHHEDQGYRYFQQIAITSLSGTLSCCPVDCTLTTLELIRAYVHDTLHHNSYRLFFPLRLFVQYVTMRYRCFLAEFDPQEHHHLHELILEAILSGRSRKLCQCLDTICGEKQSFSRLFKATNR